MEEQSGERAVVEATIQIGLDDYKAYYWYWMRRERPWWPWLMGVFLASAVLYPIWAFVSMNYTRAIYSALLFAFALYIAISAFTRPARTYKKNRAAFDAVAVYAFFEDHLCVRISDRGSDTQVTAQYSRYLWAAETGAAFYLKTPDRNYINLPKHCFTESQAAALRELFARTFGDRFKSNV